MRHAGQFGDGGRGRNLADTLCDVGKIVIYFATNKLRAGDDIDKSFARSLGAKRSK